MSLSDSSPDTMLTSILTVANLFQVSVSAFNKNADVDALDHPILNLIYYTVSVLRL